MEDMTEVLAEEAQDTLWLRMHRASGQIPMMLIRTVFRDRGYLLGPLRPEADQAWGRLAAEYLRRHPGVVEGEQWRRFRLTCQDMALGPVPTDPDAEPAMRAEARERMVYGARMALQWQQLTEGAEAHAPQYPGDVGVDLATIYNHEVQPGAISYLPLGVAFAPPANTWILLVGRSSLAAKLGLAMVPGVIDNGFRGEMLAGCYTIGPEPVYVPMGTRVAQAILVPSVQVALRQVETLPESDRGTNGFGSTGGHHA